MFDLASTQANALAKSNRDNIQQILTRLIRLETKVAEQAAYISLLEERDLEVPSNKDREIL